MCTLPIRDRCQIVVPPPPPPHVFHDSSLDCRTDGPARDIPRFSLVPPVNAETAVSDWICILTHNSQCAINNTGQQRLCHVREKVCFLCIQICLQYFSVTHTFRVVSDNVKAQAYICESLWPVGGRLDM
jgi:hypothetical protein